MAIKFMGYERTEAEHRFFASAMVAAAATAAFSFAGLFRVADPIWLGLYGTSLGIGASGFWLAVGMKWHPSNFVVPGTLFVVGILGLLGVVSGASKNQAANDARCLAIQRDMLSSMPLRSDDPDLFQALGCRPQGGGSVYAERDTKGEVGAIMEQSIRRQALPYRSPYQKGSQGVELR